MIKKAMILSAGFGKRMHPLTLDRPKPLLKIGNETLLSNTINFLETIGINQAIINVHYLGEQIINYLSKKKFNLEIKLVKESNKILDTGGGALNALHYFSNKPFLTINPDTIWNSTYLKEIKLMQELFFKNKKKKCLLLLVNKKKSFENLDNGDFNFKKNLIDRKISDKLNYIYTGLQIIRPEAFLNINKKFFSINKIWDKLILNNELYAVKSKADFLHVSNFNTYKNLLKKFKH